MAQFAGFSYAPGYSRVVSRWPGLPGRLVAVGGVPVTCGQAYRALEVLGAAGGIMVRQVLRAAGSPLADCDYHAVAAPFLDSVTARPGSGRGAAGRPVTRAAFMAAVSALLEDAAAAEPGRHFAAELGAARAAFRSDSGYAAEMARAAVALRERDHSSRLRVLVSQAVHQAVSACDARQGEFSCAAVSACGTGDCLFASGQLAGITAPAGAGRLPRPANHRQAGKGFGSGPALAALERAVPVPAGSVRVTGADSARGADSVPV